MTAREWKPGDVGLNEAHGYRGIYVQSCNIAEHGRGGDPCWHNESGMSDPAHVARRPLAVIDPNSQADQRRLLDLLRNSGAFRGVVSRDIALDCIGDALREFANPTPPKPDEPTGWLAAVVDAAGNRWCLVDGPIEPPKDWYSPDLNESRAYADIAAVRVLSDGVTP